MSEKTADFHKADIGKSIQKKKIAVLGSGNGSNFEAIAKYFKDKDVEITCISDIEDALILKRAEKAGIKNLYLPYEKNEEFFKENQFDLGVLAGYMRILNKETLAHCNFINIHPSLLPAFAGKKAIERAFKAGVKVSGVTIHNVVEKADEGKIIAQYPVFIDITTTLEDFEEEIHSVEHKLYPFVIETVLNDVLFSFDMLLKPDSCGGCGGCKH